MNSVAARARFASFLSAYSTSMLPSLSFSHLVAFSKRSQPSLRWNGDRVEFFALTGENEHQRGGLSGLLRPTTGLYGIKSFRLSGTGVSSQWWTAVTGPTRGALGRSRGPRAGQGGVGFGIHGGFLVSTASPADAPTTLLLGLGLGIWLYWDRWHPSPGERETHQPPEGGHHLLP